MSDVVALAQRWIGTPYQHQASVAGIGCDCLGLVRGVYRSIYGAEPELPPAYSADWSEVSGKEVLLDALKRNLNPVATVDYRIGSVLAFRMRMGGVVKHLGIATRGADGSARMIHSFARKGVVETPIGPSWTRRCVAQFTFQKE